MLKKAITTVLIVLTIVGLAIFFYVKSGKDSLNKTVVYLLSNELDMKYSILKSSYGDFGPDLIGYWWISFDGTWNVENIVKNFWMDNSEIEFIVEVFAREFSISNSFDGYDLYSSELNLPSKTVCHCCNCNIDILINNSRGNAFIRISKN